MDAEVAGAADLDELTRMLSAAFAEDPLWRWAFPEMEHLAAFWRLCIGSALRFRCSRFLPGYAAASIWIPPGETELDAHAEERASAFIADVAGERAGDLLELLERFESAHPRERPPHYHLTIFGTAPDRRGSGLGMSLLRDDLARIDAEHMPAYLESSNPANDARYEAVGFTRVGGFSTPDGRHRVSTMWREARL
jgi:GNAT superfamily N-acetyltransferase